MSWNNKEEIETTCTVQQWKRSRWSNKPCPVIKWPSCGFKQSLHAQSMNS